MVPGARTLRVWLHRARGVKVGSNIWIGYDVVLETSCPYLIEIGEGTSISMRATLIAHFKELRGIKIGREVFIGPGVIVLPGVTIGDRAVVAAGSVVTGSIPADTMVRGNPAVPVAKCGIPLRDDVSYLQFVGRLKPIREKQESHI
jgi:acetyltransferase-like isoleucine patch superfamily enzyme